MAADRAPSAPEVSLRRIVVIGDTGSGKTSTAQHLARRLGHSFVELDELYWAPAWQPKPVAEFRALVDEHTRGDRWVVAGNYGSARDLLWPRATAIVWLNLPLPLVALRLSRRTLRRMVRREVLWHGNRESALRTFFTRDSILWWLLTTHHRRQREFTELRRADTYPGLVWHEFRRPAEVATFVGHCGREGEAPARDARATTVTMDLLNEETR